MLPISIASEVPAMNPRNRASCLLGTVKSRVHFYNMIPMDLDTEQNALLNTVAPKRATAAARNLVWFASSVCCFS